jgi:hypothetical protein
MSSRSTSGAGEAATTGRSMPTDEVRLDVYGFRVRVSGRWPEVIDSVRRDFAWFGRPGSVGDVHASVAVERRAPQLDRFGDLAAAFVTPRNVVYQDAGRTIVDYFGKAVTVVDRATGRACIQGEDRALVHEATYHLLLSRIGEHLERRGLVRLHALGFASKAGAVAILLPSGGGKSRLALRALREPRVTLLSDDTPLLDPRGWLHPFPLRIGLNAPDAGSLPSEHVRTLERMEFHPKVVLDLAAFADRVATGPRPLRHVVIGRRTLGAGARLVPLGRRHAVAPLFREAVVGLGVYQGMEFVLQRGLRDVVGKAGTATLRARCCAVGLAKAEVWRLDAGRDGDRNWAALEPLLV